MRRRPSAAKQNHSADRVAEPLPGSAANEVSYRTRARVPAGRPPGASVAYRLWQYIRIEIGEDSYDA